MGVSRTDSESVALGRAFAGAILFGLPLFMTMEIWELGVTMRPARLALFVVVAVPLLAGLAFHTGFRRDAGWPDALIDAFVAYLVGLAAAGVVLLGFAVLEPGMSAREIVGKIALAAIPAAIGASVARSQLGVGAEGTERRRETYGGELFLMAAGALFFAFNIAPTEEITLIALRQGSPWYAFGLCLVSAGLMHAFVYALRFRGGHGVAAEASAAGEFVRVTLAGYLLVLMVSAFVLWAFGRLDGLSPSAGLHLVVVLALPGALGAAVARLVL